MQKTNCIDVNEVALGLRANELLHMKGTKNKQIPTIFVLYQEAVLKRWLLIINIRPILLYCIPQSSLSLPLFNGSSAQ